MQPRIGKTLVISMFSKELLRILSFLLVTSVGTVCTAQSPAKVEALNTYIEFLNESVHGLNVAQILFENYNKDLNKYVDLDSHKLNAFITNQEVGGSIFDNPDFSTSGNNTSAIKLSLKVKRLNDVLKAEETKIFNRLVDEIVSILNSINNLRFEIEDFINSSDLNEKENIYTSYELLERAVSQFNNYHVKHEQLTQALKRSMEYKQRPLGFILDELHSASVSMIKDLRIGNEQQIDKYLSRILGATDNLETYEVKLNADQRTKLKSIKAQVRSMTGFVTKQIQSPSIPKKYELYGKSYYMHDHLLRTYFNSISPGFVSKINNLTKMLDEGNLHYDERPVIFKVTYPEKMQEIEEIVRRPDKPLDIDLPVKVKDMELVQPTEPRQNYVVLEFYDPNLLDRDSISVSWNDEWILENYKLEEEPKKIKLDIDPLKGNSVFILAKNEGIISPNTVGFRYRFNGEGKRKDLTRNLEPNTGFELVLTIEGLGGFSDKKIE